MKGASQSRKRSVFCGARRVRAASPLVSWQRHAPDALRKKRCACGSVQARLVAVAAGAVFLGVKAFLAVVAGTAVLGVVHVDTASHLLRGVDHAETARVAISAPRLFHVDVGSVPESHLARTVLTADKLYIRDIEVSDSAGDVWFGWL